MTVKKMTKMTKSAAAKSKGGGGGGGGGGVSASDRSSTAPCGEPPACPSRGDYP